MTPETTVPTPQVIGVVLKGYPRLSETFIAQELLGLQQAGMDLRFISLRHPTDKKRHPIHEQITAPVSYLPEYLYQEPLRVLAGWWHARRLPGYRRALCQWVRDFWRDRTSNRGRRFGQALVLAAELPPEVTRLYAHFLHTPASVARYAAMMRGLPYSISAHAKDIWTIPEWEKREKLADCNWLVTCTAANADHLRGLAKDPAKVHLLYHGLDLARFADPGPRLAGSDGADGPVQLLSVGRAVEKKGYDILLAALARLPAALDWHFTHIGGGPLLPGLKAKAEQLGIAARIDWRGSDSQDAVLAALRRADLFTLASRITGNGDRDGLPNVLMEAQSQRLPVVSTAVSAIPEFIVEGESGLLVPSEDPAALAAALERLIRDPALRVAFGAAGNKRLRERFSADACLKPLLTLFGRPVP
ncbi:glycosyltransferase [Radicibacter daui]|uniref:glycosyltransferase n=1 Tax=Radicibacter daui TaxID=3064829 RepID=UPI004046DC1C